MGGDLQQVVGNQEGYQILGSQDQQFDNVDFYLL